MSAFSRSRSAGSIVTPSSDVIFATPASVAVAIMSLSWYQRAVYCRKPILTPLRVTIAGLWASSMLRPAPACRMPFASSTARLFMMLSRPDATLLATPTMATFAAFNPFTPSGPGCVHSGLSGMSIVVPTDLTSRPSRFA